MYVAGMIMTVLALLPSALGALLIAWFMSDPDPVIFGMGLMVTVPALLPASIAMILFVHARKKKPRTSFLVRLPWLPLCAPVFVAAVFALVFAASL